MHGMMIGSSLLLVLLLAPTAIGAQGRTPTYDFCLWQIEPDSSRFHIGDVGGGGSSNMDFRLLLKPTRGLFGRIGYRLDADFVVHRRGDSTLLVGEIRAARVLSEESVGSMAGDRPARARLEEETYRRSLVVSTGSAAWFYPFGVPGRGERGLVLEISEHGLGTPARAGCTSDRKRPPVMFLTKENYAIEVRGRMHQARVRLEIGSGESWRTVFEGDALTRVPVRVAMGGQGARGQDLMFELQAPEWGIPFDLQDSLCWRWYWADQEPPSGGACASVDRGTVVQRLYGGGFGHLRVVILSAS